MEKYEFKYIYDSNKTWDGLTEKDEDSPKEKEELKEETEE